MNDRVAVNHATVTKVNESRGKTFNELNCHLHPLDTIASSCRSALKSVETTKGQYMVVTALQPSLHCSQHCSASQQTTVQRWQRGSQRIQNILDDNGLPLGVLPS